MKIKKMTTTFGCLDGEVLELSGGMDCFVIPNEGGKSTWAAFLAAMFYGLDSRRAAKGRLPDKERYAPWSGKPMEGTVELSLEGRTIVLQRTSLRGKPFGVFRAWDQNTGLAISSLTAENCGRELLGVEREVFRRSAFLTGSELAISPDQDLSRRLSALAASGRETDSFLQADSRLRSWQNHLRYHQSGEIPRLERQLAEMEKEPSADTSHLPSEETLWRLLSRLEHSGQTEEVCPAALAGVAEDQILRKAGKDLAKYRTFSVIAAVLCLVFLACGVWVSPTGFVLGALALAGFVWCMCTKRLARGYGVRKRKDILPAALRWLDGEKRRWEQSVLLEEIRDFAPEADTVAEAKEAVERALSAHRQAAQSRQPDEGEKAALQRRLAELLRKERAIMLARQALGAAEEQLQKTYVPYLTRLAGDYLERLTLGRYDGLVMDAAMELSVKEAGGLLRPLAALSRGTQDQTWLALRLAMTKLLLPEGAPVVLDDALLTFDREREAAAMEVLRQEDRQIILFSCR